MPTLARAQLQEFIALLDAGNTARWEGVTASLVRVQEETVSKVQTNDSSNGISHTVCQVRWHQSRNKL